MSQLTYFSIPTYTDLLNSTLVRDKPVTPTILKAIHHNALFAAVRCEWFDMGYWTSTLKVPQPVSPVDGYQYSYAETTFIPVYASSRQPNTVAGAPIAGSPTGLIRDVNGLVTVFLSAPLSPTPAVGMTVTIINTISVGGTNFNGVFTIVAVISPTEFQYQQPASLGPDTGGGITTAWSSNTTEALGNLIIDSNGNVQRVTAITGDAKTGGSAPTWATGIYVLTTDNHVTWTNEGANGAWVAFRPGQLMFPQLNSADPAHSGNLILSPYVLKVSSSGVVTSQVYFSGSGTSDQCTIHVIAVGQRNGPSGPLTFADGIPTFLDIDDSLLRGGSFLNQTLIRQMNMNAKFAAVRMEVFDSGYYANGNTIAPPTSPVDGYAYSLSELLYVTVLASTRQPASGTFTPGQPTFPVLSNSDVGTGQLLESPYLLRVDAGTGVLTCQMYFAGSGLANQGTVHVFTVAQRSSVQVQR